MNIVIGQYSWDPDREEGTVFNSECPIKKDKCTNIQQKGFPHNFEESEKINKCPYLDGSMLLPVCGSVFITCNVPNSVVFIMDEDD